MTAAPTLMAERLRLRQWRDSDLDPFAALNADPNVMEYLPNVLGRAESDDLAVRIRAHFAQHGFGLWAVEVSGVVDFAGFAGLSVPAFDAHFMPSVEIGWRLARACWGRGYATEAAAASLAYAFCELRLSEVVSFTVRENRRSRRVMERLGMRRKAADDFEHPALRAGHLLRRHVLYRIVRDDWERDSKPKT